MCWRKEGDLKGGMKIVLGKIYLFIVTTKQGINTKASDTAEKKSTLMDFKIL